MKKTFYERKMNCPEGWAIYKDEYRYQFTDKSSALYQSCVHYNFNSGLTLIKFSNKKISPIDEVSTRKEFVSKMKSLFQFNKYLCVVEQMKGNVSSEFHCILNKIPSQEQLLSIKEIFNSYVYL